MSGSPQPAAAISPRFIQVADLGRNRLDQPPADGASQQIFLKGLAAENSRPCAVTLAEPHGNQFWRIPSRAMLERPVWATISPIGRLG